MITWPAAPGTAATDGAFHVSVNGRPIDVVYIEKPSYADGQLQWKGGPDNLHPYYFAGFDSEDEVEIAVTSERDLSKSRIYPSRLGVRPSERAEHRVVFRAKPPFKLAFEPQLRHRALILSAQLPEKDVPDPNDPNVRWFGPGRYHLEKPIVLGKGQTLYLAPGAWVEAAVFGRGCDGARICGRGVLSGLCWPWKKGPADRMIDVSGRGIRIEGVTVVGSYHWTVVLERCEDAVVRGINVLNGHVLNDDGIDVVNGRNVTIEDVFVRAQDDCIAIKFSCEGVKVRNAVLWSDVANIFRIGWECSGRGFRFADIDVKGVDVVHQSIHKPNLGALWSEYAVYVQASNDMPFENLSFADFRFDAPEKGDNLACLRTQITRSRNWRHALPGDIRRVVFDGMAFPNGLPAKSESIYVENVYENRSVDDVRFANVGGKVPFVAKGKVTNCCVTTADGSVLTPVAPCVLHLAGDSTLAKRRPDESSGSWGEALRPMLAPGFRICNYAIAGTSTKTFRPQWETNLIRHVEKGDCVLVQFGHNDPCHSPKKFIDREGCDRYATVDEFRENLTRYVREVQDKGASVVLLTPMPQRAFFGGADWHPSARHLPYFAVVPEVARETGADFIDMTALGGEVVRKMGVEGSRSVYRVNPDGKPDDIHPNKEGARLLARLFLDEVKRRGLAVGSLFD